MKRAQIPLTAPEEVKIALRLYAESMTERVISERSRKHMSTSDANLHLLYRSKSFQSYLIQARAIIKSKQESVSDSEGGNTK